MKTLTKVTTGIDINAPIDKVWEALTKPEIIEQYFFNTWAESDWEVGSSITFKGEWEGKKYEDKGVIKEMVPCTRFKYSYWSSFSNLEDKPENYADITYELKRMDGFTHLEITQEILDEKTKADSEKNWKTVLDELKKVLEKEHIET